MKILDRYIIREFFKLFSLTMLTFTLLYLVVDFFSRIRMFLSNNATTYQIATHFGFGIPQIISHTMPVSVLLASLLTFSLLSKNSEIVALKSSGISLYRASLPLLVSALLISAFSFVFNEVITPYANQKAKYIEFVEVKKLQKMGAFKQNQIWYRSKNAIYNFALFDPQTNTLKGITINYIGQNFELTMRIDAKEARWQDGQWIFSDLLITTFSTDHFPVLEKVTSRAILLPETPTELKAVQKDTDEMGYLELRNYIRKLQAEGFDAARYLADMHGKIAFTLVNLILAVLGISFSLRSERSGGVALSIGSGIIIGFSYWIVFAFSISLGRSTSIPPFLAAWSANFILGIAAAVLYLRVKT